jgi:hypothetical protein
LWAFNLRTSMVRRSGGPSSQEAGRWEARHKSATAKPSVTQRLTRVPMWVGIDLGLDFDFRHRAVQTQQLVASHTVARISDGLR